MDEPISFGYWVRRRRKALDLTQTDLARQVGCAADTIGKIEGDLRRPSRQLAELLADRLRIPPDERAAFLQSARGIVALDRLPSPPGLSEQIADGDVGASAVRPHNLPAELTSFVGRERELATAAKMLEAARLITLTGPGGTGKTRLARRLAADVLERFPDGVWLVELAPLADPALILQTIAVVLAVREESGRPLQATLISHLRDKDLLLLLDNCEHLIDDCARIADTLLHACPHLRILASSREPLGVGGEAVFRIPALALPPLPLSPAWESHVLPLDKLGNRLSKEGPGGESRSSPSPAHWESHVLSLSKGGPGGEGGLAQYEAARLFVERARAVRPEFAATVANAAALAQICRRLDGIPLAIELAAARARVLTVEQIAARLDDRFRLLLGGSRTALPRHQALQASIDWSYDLLTDDERALLRRLAVFVGGWTLEAAEAVCDFGFAILDFRLRAKPESVQNPKPKIQNPDVLSLLTHLVDKSLVQFEPGQGAARYHMLETIRQYALEKLAPSGEADAVRQRHMAYYLALIQNHELFDSHEQWYELIETEHDNLRAALTWCQSADGAAEQGLCLTDTLTYYWIGHGRWSEARGWIEGALAHPAAGRAEYTRQRARLLHDLGFMYALQGEYATGQAYLAESLELARQLDERSAIAWLLHRQGWLAREQGNASMARQRLEESLALHRKIDDEEGAAWALVTLGEVAVLQEDVAWGKELLQDGLARFRALNVPQGIAWALNHLGHVAQIEGAHDQAARFHDQSVPLFRESAERDLWDLGLAWAFHGLDETALAQGDTTAGSKRLAEALRLFHRLSDRAGIAWCLGGVGSAAALNEAPERAARLWGAAEALRAAIGARPAPAARATYERALATARAHLGDEAFAAAWNAGQALPLEQAIAEALAGR